MAAIAMNPDTISLIPEWYSGQSILITGGTGFMGKVLIEKLLRACPNIKNIYLLIRTKKGQAPRKRIDDMIQLPLFENLHKINKSSKNDIFKKLIPISGDIMLPDLGLSAQDRAVLTQNVSIVFHSAATVKFDEVLKLSVEMNIVGTKRLLSLCHNMVHIKAFIHVSTAYCNCDKPRIEEVVYRTNSDPEKIIRQTEVLDNDLIEELTPRLIGDKPNTYTFTKALAEEVLVQNCGKLPVAIVRPSIVTAAFQEPLPGWIDNLNGPTGLFIGGGKGVLRTLLCHRHLRADFVPVDIAINLLITVAWDIANSKPRKIMVYNCASGKLNPIHWCDVENYGRKFVTKHPFNDVLWYPGGSFKSGRLYNRVCEKVFHTLPAYLLDYFSIITFKKPIMVNIHNKMTKAIRCLEYFATHEWTFENDNVVALQAKLSQADEELFNFDIRRVKWDDYIEQYVIGTRKFVLKEDDSTIPAAKSHLLRMYFVHRISQVLICYLLWRTVMSRSTLAQEITYSSMGMVYKFCLNLKDGIFSRFS